MAVLHTCAFMSLEARAFSGVYYDTFPKIRFAPAMLAETIVLP